MTVSPIFRSASEPFSAWMRSNSSERPSGMVKVAERSSPLSARSRAVIIFVRLAAARTSREFFSYTTVSVSTL